MRNNKDELKEWADRMERGEREDDLLVIAARLEQLEDGALPSVEFQRQLRRDLLNQFSAVMHPPRQVWQRVGLLASLGLLAAFVFAIWMSISSSGRHIPGDAPVDGAPLATATSDMSGLPLSGFRLMDYSVSGGIVIEMTQTDGGKDQTQFLLVPGMTAEITTRWRIEGDGVESPRFALHLLDSNSRMIAQSDAPIQAMDDSDGQTGEAVLVLEIPADLPSGEYELSGGLFDATTGDRLSFYSPQDEVMETMRTDLTVGSGNNSPFTVTNGASDGLGSDTPTFGLLEPDRLVVREVSPPNGAALAGTAPVDFVITIDYALGSLPQAVLEVRVVDLSGENGRGVGLTTVENISQGSSTATVVVTVDLGTELSGPTDLGLWLQIRPDPTAPPILIEKPEMYRWRYTR